MEIATRQTGPAWIFPAWLEPRLISDARFARAYDAIGDQRRALLKSIIAHNFALNPPASVLREQHHRMLASGLRCRSSITPRPFILLLVDSSLDAPALLLGALMPALCSGAADVLVVRLGSRASVPESLLTSCELAGQERVASLSATLAAQLLIECAQSGLPGLVLHPDTPEMRRVLNRPALRTALDSSFLRLAPLRVPRGLGVWRDTVDQFALDALAFLYAGLELEAGGAKPGRGASKPQDKSRFQAFASVPRELLLVPDACVETAPSAARLVLGESCSGLWTWPELSDALFTATMQACTTAPETQF
ncbi:MAG: hypothetical protein RDU24_04095 [Humidesulfovibrio sp.]|uniref:hypothetical protein n=1 Tax=Humidesulfovibrio sp. TaxID=2910988 RepID=UPI0027E7976F|nr:hypothetical protein [Humidesulfovibrio sp.]MDQ7834541.1 hypothetical protein [Humidesulfovibrio sp.]